MPQGIFTLQQLHSCFSTCAGIRPAKLEKHFYLAYNLFTICPSYKYHYPSRGVENKYLCWTGDNNKSSSA